jgi:nitroimidazol reductase NimA-like FMN-containing flavoprotein (pyridoxamine 5'-phosphate oxidase superfamily)
MTPNRSPLIPDADDAFGPLGEAECRELLATQSFGRVGMTSGALPIILPVCYVYADDTITFRTGAGPKLRAAAGGDVLAFEVDAFDSDANQGWSVLVLGRATILTTEYEHDGLPTFDLAAADDQRNHYVRLHCEMVTGRRLAPPRA